MSEPIVCIDTSAIREGRFEELATAVKELAGFVETNESRPLFYSVYLDAEASRMTVLQVHPDSASMEHHMDVAGPAFPRFVDLLELQTMDVYGHPSEGLLDRLRAKIELLGRGTLSIHEPSAGFARFPGAST